MSERAPIKGRVYTSADGGRQGVSGVCVSDGLAVTVTDQEGHYRLDVEPERRASTLVAVTVPAGFEVAADRWNHPMFHRRVVLGGDGGGATGVDFELLPSRLSRDATYRFVGLADVHVEPGALNTRETFLGQLSEVNRSIAELGRAPGAGAPRFAVVAGDLTNNATPQEFRDYKSATAGLSVPIWPAVGNHDLDGRVAGGAHPGPARASMPYRDMVEPYRQEIGPEWYSFQYGQQHYVVLENYLGLAEKDQLTWLERDLEANAREKQVVVVAHVPWNVPQTPGPNETGAYLKVFEQHDVQLLLAGHTHMNDAAPGPQGVGLQAVITSASRTSDQTPRGYRIIEIGPEAITAPFAEFGNPRAVQVVHPVGRVPVPPERLHVSRYRPPFVETEVEFKVHNGPWTPMRIAGSSAWSGELGAVATGVQQLAVRCRDGRDEAWVERMSEFEVAQGQLAPRGGADWPMPHGGPTHTGRSTDALAPPLSVAWVHQTGGAVGSASAALRQGAAIIGVRDEDGLGRSGVHALDLTTGRLIWRFATSTSVDASVAIAKDVALVAPVRGPLLGVDSSDGTERWRWSPCSYDRPNTWMYYAPTVADDVVYQPYVLNDGAGVAALRPDTGEELWRTATPYGRNWMAGASPAVAGGALYFATAYANVVALDLAHGRLRWQSALGGGIVARSAPTIVGDLVVMNRQGDVVVALDAATGSRRWEFRAEGSPRVPGAVTSSTPASADGVVYAGFTDGSLVALDSEDGAVIWRATCSGGIAGSPVVSGPVVYVAATDGCLHAFDRRDGRTTWSYALGAPLFSSPSISGNMLVIATWDGNVYAFTASG